MILTVRIVPAMMKAMHGDVVAAAVPAPPRCARAHHRRRRFQLHPFEAHGDVEAGLALEAERLQGERIA